MATKKNKAILCVDDDTVQNAFKNSNLKYFISKPWNKNDLIDKVNEVLKN